MDLSVFLAKLFGLYYIIAGVIIWMRQRSLIPVVAQLGESRVLVLIVALVELIAGLAIAIAHPVYEFNWQGVITAIGWIMIAESVLCLAAPHPVVRKFIRYFNRSSWYASGAAISVGLGIYLAGSGFGWW